MVRMVTAPVIPLRPDQQRQLHAAGADLYRAVCAIQHGETIDPHEVMVLTTAWAYACGVCGFETDPEAGK